MAIPDHLFETIAVAVTGTAAWVWKHLTGRIGALEDKVVAQTAFDKHVEDQNEQFRRLYDRHDRTIADVSEVKAGVARIEGVLSNMNRN